MYRVKENNEIDSAASLIIHAMCRPNAGSPELANPRSMIRGYTASDIRPYVILTVGGLYIDVIVFY
jgi:hypothetical protein